jgi:polysaccharide pyruvyl transferase WcaK-like protein
MLNVEIKGIDFNNKGALLMLESIICEFKRRNVEANFYCLLSKDAKLRKFYPVGFTFPRHLAGVYVGFIDSLVPNRISKIINHIKIKDIDVVIDSSGFAYGDTWGAEKASARMGTKSHKYSSKTKYIMLPQALGPFDNRKLKEEMKYILRKVDVIFARDQQSYNFLSSIEDAKLDNVSISPDFTQSLYSKYNGSKFIYKKNEKSAFVVPNIKIIEKQLINRKQYVQWFVDFIKVGIVKGYNMSIINHEGKGDGELCNEIASSFDSVEVLTSVDPLELKAMINTYDFGLVSRYHAAVSSLCQSIPVGIIGWSHKYKELARDYNMESLVIEMSKCPEQLFNELLDLSINSKEELAGSKKINVMKNEEMWEKVFTCLNNPMP